MTRKITSEMVSAYPLCNICSDFSKNTLVEMVLRHGPYGAFFGCSHFPLCKSSCPVDDRFLKEEYRLEQSTNYNTGCDMDQGMEEDFSDIELLT